MRGPVDVAEVEPEREFVEGESGTDSVKNGEQAADENVFRSGAAAGFGEPCVTDAEQYQDAPDEVVDVLAAQHDPSEGADVVGDAGDQQTDAEEGDEEADSGEEEAAARAIGNADVDDASEVGAVQQEEDGGGDEDGEDEQNVGAGHCGDYGTAAAD